MAPPSDKPRAERRDARANRRRLLDAAGPYFAAHGISAPLRGLAAAAGLGEATLYRHFPDHDALVRALYDEMVAGFGLLLAEADREPTRGKITIKVVGARKDRKDTSKIRVR